MALSKYALPSHPKNLTLSKTWCKSCFILFFFFPAMMVFEGQTLQQSFTPPPVSVFHLFQRQSWQSQCYPPPPPPRNFPFYFLHSDYEV